jgi:putative transposase
LKQKRYKPKEIIRLLRGAISSNLLKEEFYRQKQISLATFHRWIKKYGLISEANAKRLKTLKIKCVTQKIHAEAKLGIKVLKETVEKKF